MKINPKKLFLIDGLGAIASAFLLGIILVKYEASFGMPITVLYFLASIACMFAIYSICCCFLLGSNWRPYLKGIAVANLLYGFITIVLVSYFFQKLTIFGLAYFVLELFVLSGVIIIEARALSPLIDRKI